MAEAGEVNQAIGQAYQYVFVGALEHSIRYFENQFHVHENPEKLSFRGRTGKPYSFDFGGIYRHPMGVREVFGESKGYSRGDTLIREFRLFLARAYVTSVDHSRHRRDFFWFVTNVPFACSEGRSLLSTQFAEKVLSDPEDRAVREIIGNPDLDAQLIRDLIGRTSVFILTDSFLQQTSIRYKVKPGETIWSILRRMHAGHAPSDFRRQADLIAHNNDLPSPDKVISGKVLKLSWKGIRVN